MPRNSDRPRDEFESSNGTLDPLHLQLGNQPRSIEHCIVVAPEKIIAARG
jgi:hypothetical protein